MLNMYDFISGNASHFKQLNFGKNGDVFIDYLCPITDNKKRIWSHKNCLLYVMQGVKEYSSLDHYHKSSIGEILFIRKGGYVLFQHFKKPYRALIFMFNDETIKILLQEYPQLLKTEYDAKTDFLGDSEIILPKPTSLIKSIFLSCLIYLQSPEEESHISLELKFKELLINLLRNKEDNVIYMYLSWLSLEKKAPFIKLMKDNSHLNFTLEELSRTAGMSLTTFKRTFKKYFEQSPGKWLLNQRISKAKSLLNKPENTISNIAFELGYSNVAAFSKAFKSKTGLNPSNYIKNKSYSNPY